MKTVGKQLEEARVAKDWSPELAARETKIKIERLRDLESDDFSNFSSPTYARGFVRTYARSLGLDEYKLLRQLDNKLPEDDNASFANDTGIPYMPEPSQASTPYRFGTGVYVAMGAGATVLFLIAFILFQSYRAGYFTQASPVAVTAQATNVASPMPDSDQVARAMPADSNAAPVALPVDVNASPAPTAADAGTNAAPVATPVSPAAIPVAPTAVAVDTNAPAAVVTSTPTATTPLDTKSPPRALPVDLNAMAAVPDSSAATAVPTTPATNAPVAVMVPVATPTPAPVYHAPPSLSARDANQRPAPAPVAQPAAAAAVVPAATFASTAPAQGTPAVATTPPVAVSAPASAPTTTPGSAANTTLTGEATAAPPAASESPASKRLVLTASRDSYIRVVSLDDPNGQQVRYSSVLHEGQSISFSDRKYSINVGVPSAVDILLDGINYGPHSDHSGPDTFTVESHQP